MLSPIGTWDEGKETLLVEPASAPWQASAAPKEARAGNGPAAQALVQEGRRAA